MNDPMRPPPRLVRLRALQLRELSLRLERMPWRVPNRQDALVIESAATLLETFVRSRRDSPPEHRP